MLHRNKKFRWGNKLKYKQANSEFVKNFPGEKQLGDLFGNLQCKPPNEHIYEFDGKFILELDSNVNGKNNNKTIFAEKESFLLRGCSLRQTEYIYGFVVYVGHNTKIMK